MFTFLVLIGSACFVICNLALPFRTLYEYKHSPDHPRRAVIGSSVMMLLAFLNVLSWIVFVTHPLSLKDLVAAYSINLFVTTLLVYTWTAPSARWKRRHTRKSFVVMALLGVILLLATALIFVGIFGVYL